MKTKRIWYVWRIQPLKNTRLSSTRHLLNVLREGYTICGKLVEGRKMEVALRSVPQCQRCANKAQGIHESTGMK